MSIQLNPGITRTLAVQDSAGNDLWSQSNISQEEAKKFVQQYGKSVPGWGGLRAAFVVMRTDNLKDCAKDLFFPNLVNGALKIENGVARVFAAIAMVFIDLITMPFRLVIAPFRAIYNKCKTPEAPHPLTKLLQEKISPDKRSLVDAAIKNGSLVIVTREDSVKITDDPQDPHYENAVKTSTVNAHPVTLKQAMASIKQDNTNTKNDSYYKAKNKTSDHWVRVGYGSSGGGSSSFSF